MRKRALILGISGQDGAYLAKYLLDRGYSVVGSSRDPCSQKFFALEYMGLSSKVEIIKLSLQCPEEICKTLSKIQPDEVYNLAGQTSVAQSFETPLIAYQGSANSTIFFLEAIRSTSQSVKYFNACSSDCYGDTPHAGATEETPFRPRSPYALGKAIAFWTTKVYREAYGLHACSAILFSHESPFRPESFVTQKIIAAVKEIAAGKRRKLKIGNPDIERDWGWAPDYVSAMHEMLQQERPKDFVIATGESHKIIDFVQLAFDIEGLDWRAYVKFDAALERPNDVMLSRANPKKVLQELGWKSKTNFKDVVSGMLGGANEIYTH